MHYSTPSSWRGFSFGNANCQVPGGILEARTARQIRVVAYTTGDPLFFERLFMPTVNPVIDRRCMSNNEIIAIQKAMLGECPDDANPVEEMRIGFGLEHYELTTNSAKISLAYRLNLSVSPAHFDHAKLLDTYSVFEIWPPSLLRSH